MFEKPFFAPLWRVRTSGSFVLRIPTVGQREGGGEGEESGFHAVTVRRAKPAGEGIVDAYLEGDNLEGAPFVVVRAPRPDYMHVHLESVGMHRRERLALPAPP